MKKYLITAAIILASSFVIVPLGYSYHQADVPERGLHRPVSASATPFKQKDVIVNGLRLRYIDEGTGYPVLLIPGHASRIEQLDRLTAVLRLKFRVLVFDFPGSGYSEKPEREYDLRFYEDTIAAFLDAVGVDECYIAGESLGGNLALRAAYRWPERFPRVVVWSPASAWDAKPELAALLKRFGGKTIFWPTIHIQSGYWFSEDAPQREQEVNAVMAYIREVVSPGFIMMYWGLATDQVAWSLQEIVADIGTPTLLIWGELDNGFGLRDGARKLAAMMPHVEAYEYADAGHCLLVERKEMIIERIQDFLLRPAEALP